MSSHPYLKLVLPIYVLNEPVLPITFVLFGSKERRRGLVVHGSCRFYLTWLKKLNASRRYKLYRWLSLNSTWKLAIIMNARCYVYCNVSWICYCSTLVFHPGKLWSEHSNTNTNTKLEHNNFFTSNKKLLDSQCKIQFLWHVVHPY